MSAPNLTTAMLTVGSTVYALPLIETPLNEQTIENAIDVQTLDFDVYTDFISTRRIWTFTWSFLDKAAYDEIKAIYASQFTVFEYPKLSIPFYDIANVSVRMTINEKKIANVAGGVVDVQITLRETAQLT